MSYSLADDAGKCDIDLRKENDSDKYCDSTNEIQSYKAIAEKDRRSNLTPKQLCEEDNKDFYSDEAGEAFFVTCDNDGAHTVKSEGQIDAEADAAMEDYYSSQSYYEPDEPAQASNCHPSYSPCVPDSGYDLDCPDVGFTVQVVGYDSYRLDRDGDGYGCE